MQTFRTRLAAEWQRFTCRIREASRLRRTMGELSAMSPHELRDIGFTHPAMALAAAGDAPLPCR